MKKKNCFLLIITVFVLLLIVYLLFSTDNKRGNSPELINNTEKVLFEKTESWGPCPPNTICKLDTKIYYSGKMITRGQIESEYNISKENISEIIKAIRETKIMEKECKAPIVLDYMVNYNLSIDGREKEIQFPGCEGEIEKIEKLIPEVEQLLKGGE